MASLLELAVIVFLSPALLVFFAKPNRSRVAALAIIMLCASAVSQLTFMILMDKDIVQLDRSYRFFAIGGPCGVAAIVLAAKSGLTRQAIRSNFSAWQTV